MPELISSLFSLQIVCTANERDNAKSRHQQMINTKNLRTPDRSGVIISNVPAIISTSASPTDILPLNAIANNVPSLMSKRHGRLLQKSSGCEQYSVENDSKSFQAFENFHVQHPNEQLQQQFSHTRSDDLTYCTKCGGLTTMDKRNLSKKQYFSLEKDGHEKTFNFLQCLAMTRTDTSPKCDLENILSSGGRNSEKPFGRSSNNNQNNTSNNNNINNNQNTNFSGSTSKTLLSTARKPCDRCDDNNESHTKNGGKSTLSKKGSRHRSECGTSCTNHQSKDKSNKSSQNSLREPRIGHKNGIFHLGSSDRDNSTHRSKRASQQYGRKASTRGPFNLHEEQDAETREILLGGTSNTSHSKVKLPEKVEAVCLFISSINLVYFFFSFFDPKNLSL